MKAKKTLVSPVNSAEDVLETAEVVRSANCVLRMAVGITGFANDICGAEVISEERHKTLESSFNVVFEALRDVYASLMGRYSALSASSVGDQSKN